MDSLLDDRSESEDKAGEYNQDDAARGINRNA